MSNHSNNNPFYSVPGFSVNKKIGWERWHKSSQFDWLNGQVPYLVEQKRPMTAASYPFPSYPADTKNKYPSLYPQRDTCEIPSWIIYDKQVLSFDAYFEDSFEHPRSRDRKVKINFYLEDGTVQVNEQRTKSSGFPQGTLLGRRRIPYPKPMEKAFYEVIDFNIGKTVEFFGRIYCIVDCDKFTRQWLNRSGIAVPEAMQEKQICQEKKENQSDALSAKPSVKKDKLGQFLKFDGHVLRFYAYWDDRQSESGGIYKLIVQYYLSDDTIDVREDGGRIMLARTRLPRAPTVSSPPQPGASDPVNLLNVVTSGYLKGRTVKDAKNVGALVEDYYTDADLLPGATINVYGRAVVLTGCDPFTQDFYRTKYGIDHMEQKQVPDENEGRPVFLAGQRDLPPWNGFGTFEDSAGNCVSLIPKPYYGNIALKLEKARAGLDSNILRFRARMISDEPLDQGRSFIVSFYLADNTTSIFEMAERNSGFERRMFIKRKEAFKPTECLLVSRKPSTYTKDDFWIGNDLDIDNYKFNLLEADEYTLRYMEINSQEFPKSNIELIMLKIRSKLRENYKDFVKNYLLVDGSETIQEDALRRALTQLLGSNITPHEIITVARNFSIREIKKQFNKEKLRNMCRNECRRLLFNGFERLCENLKQKDPWSTGYLPRNVVYALCKGAKIPIETTVLNALLEEVDQNEKCEVNINDLLSFFDPSQNPCVTLIPFHPLRDFTDSSSFNRSEVSVVDCIRLIESLGLEEGLKKEG